MTDSLNPKIKLLFLSRLLGSSFCVFAILSCSSLSKKTPLHSKHLNFKIQWDYSSPLKKESRSFLSLVSVQGDQLLRLDILQPFIGVIGSFILNGQTMILQIPLKKQYYKGEFHSKVFFPNFPSLPSSWLIALLRAQAPHNWNCQKQNGKITQCDTHHFEIQWEYKQSQLYKISLKDSKQRRIQAQIKSLSSQRQSPGTFEPSLKNWQRQKEPLFFQKL